MLKKMDVAITECQNEMLQQKQKIILTSYGLTTPIGRKLIGAELAKEPLLHTKRIFLFHEPHYHLEELFILACIEIGFTKENIILSGYQKSNSEILSADFIYVTEGNTFEILSLLRQKELDAIIQKACTMKATYIASSAGAMIAGPSIEEALSF